METQLVVEPPSDCLPKKLTFSSSVANDVENSTNSGKHPLSTNAGKGVPNGSSIKVTIKLEDKFKIEQPDFNVNELLGSVTIHNCPGVRTSARVIQKMKQDSNHPNTSPNTTDREHGKAKDEKIIPKTPSQVRAANKPNWTNVERNYFFDAINELGKDFEAIGNFINAKLKRKSISDPAFKTKEHVRQQYYQTYHKICKYIKFSEEVKKLAQELYALINYGEMRRKLQFVSEKHFIKLRHLIYNGHITIRCKGKNIRIKTPSCKALRKLNQLDDTLEDLRLPSKIEVFVSPANMETFGKVQMLAQNPKVRATVPLHKKLINFIKTFQYKWRSPEMRLAEEEAKLFSTSLSSHVEIACTETQQPTVQTSFQDPEICFMPKTGVTIHRPLLSITGYLSSNNLCLTAYEERLGVKQRGESLCFNRTSNNKRQRSDSGSEKRSPEMKKCRNIPADATTSSIAANTVKDELKTESVDSNNAVDEFLSNELSNEISDLLCDTTVATPATESVIVFPELNEEVDSSHPVPSASEKFDTELSEKSLPPQTVVAVATTKSKKSNDRRRGGGGGGGEQTTKSSSSSSASASSSASSSSSTYKPLISDDVIKKIRKGWTASNAADITIGDLYVVFGLDSKLHLEYYWPDRASDFLENTLLFVQKQNGISANVVNDCDTTELMTSLGASKLGNRLKNLLLIANLSERIRKRQCSCGHICCEKGPKYRTDRDPTAKSYVSRKTFPTNSDSSTLFRQPVAPFRCKPSFTLDPGSIVQLQNASRMKISRQVVVQRSLLPGGLTQQYDLVEMKNLQNNLADEKRRNERSAPDTTHDVRVPDGEVNKTSSMPSNLLQIETNCGFVGTQTNATSTISDREMNDNDDNDDGGSFATITSVPDSHQQATTTTTTAATITATSTPSKDFSRRSPTPTSLALPDNIFPFHSNHSILSGNASPVSPMHFFRDSSSNSRWLEENLNDFSLTSLLGHLDDINGSRDIIDPSSNLSVISESSVDYMTKFAEITASMQNEDKDF